MMFSELVAHLFWVPITFLMEHSPQHLASHYSLDSEYISLMRQLTRSLLTFHPDISTMRMSFRVPRVSDFQDPMGSSRQTDCIQEQRVEYFYHCGGMDRSQKFPVRQRDSQLVEFNQRDMFNERAVLSIISGFLDFASQNRVLACRRCLFVTKAAWNIFSLEPDRTSFFFNTSMPYACHSFRLVSLFPAWKLVL